MKYYQKHDYYARNYFTPGNESEPTADTIGTMLVPMLKYDYIFQINYTEAILSNDARKLWFEISKILIAVKK